MIYFNIDWLKKNYMMAHYFGLGFIQIKIDDKTRMHFYSKDLPRVLPDEEIHNHRYHFNSFVYRGELDQEIFDVVSGNTHTKEFEACKEGVEVDLAPVACGIRLNSQHTYIAGSRYKINHHVFHRVKCVDYCVTLLTRSGYQKDYAEVIRPAGSEKVCPFSEKMSDGKIWEIVAELLK